MIFEWLTIELTLSILAIGVSVWSVYRNKKDGLSQLAFERRLEVYSELAYLLQFLLADHNKIAELRPDVYAIITKSYFFSSAPIDKLFQKFLVVYEEEAEIVDQLGESRDTSFNKFDAFIMTLIECMKYEAREKKDITDAKVEEILEHEFGDIGTQYI